MPKNHNPAHELAAHTQGVNAEITLRGLFLLLTESIRNLCNARYLPEDTRRSPRTNDTNVNQAGRHPPSR